MIHIKIKVCDAVMGAGKTESAIAFMNSHTDRRFIFVTPFLDEVDRIQKSCPALKFQTPGEHNGRTKLIDCEMLLRTKNNIVTTHVLFSMMRPLTLDLIRAGHYTLILDEVMDVISIGRPSDYKCTMSLIDRGKFRVEDDFSIAWCGEEDLRPYLYQELDLIYKAQRHNLVLYKNTLLLWTLPTANFSSFEEIYILTYMFHAQIQRCYYDLYGFEYEYIGTERTEDGFRFTDKPNLPENLKGLASHIHILDDLRKNAIGQHPRYDNPLNDPSLSSSWYRRGTERGREEMQLLQKFTSNVCFHVFEAKAKDYIWTTFSEYETKMKGKMSAKSFVSCRARATNKYRDRHYLFYLINVYHNPVLTNYLNELGVEVDNDAYALSELVQWLFRSAIRNGEDVHIYIPSIRMRTLLQQWLDRLSAGEPY